MNSFNFILNRAGKNFFRKEEIILIADSIFGLNANDFSQIPQVKHLIESESALVN